MAAPTLHHSKAGDGLGAPTDDGLHLTVMGANLFETYPLPVPGRVDVGREEGAHVRLVDGLASRLHARLHIERSGQISVEDLGSRNGTFVRGERIGSGKSVTLQPGEAITIGFTHLMVHRHRPQQPTRRLRSHAAFEERLDDACERANRGMGAGPAVIRARIANEEPAGRGADVIQGALRPGDLLAQYAEGDYEILLLDTDAGRVRSIADGLARRVRMAGLSAETAIVAYPTQGRTAEALIGSASAVLLDLENETESAPVLKSDSMRALYRLAERAAAGPSATGLITVLVLGETGTGKEVLASWIHRRSPRGRGPFLCINCAALPETLLESELFGHEKGAFTGANVAKPGLLESAVGGTVFLDEIGEMNAALQTKLLRTIESREILRVGGRSARPIDVRFIAATNRDLEADVANKSFRQDLYFRLNGISLTVPPLRERCADIAPLARRFVVQASRAAKRRPPRLSSAALELLEGYAWPGNIRELRNVIERALVMCEGSEIGPAHLPVEKLRLRPILPTLPALPTLPTLPVLPEPAPRGSTERAADARARPTDDDDRERQRIAEAMATFGGNQTKVAAALGMARGTLIARLERYGIRRPQASRRRAG